mgnify:FL=1
MFEADINFIPPSGSSLTEDGELPTVKEARTCELSNKQQLTMQEEIKSLHANNTWYLVKLPNSKKAM